jgi:lipoprotein-anchoring transpeptidase ErfK/SrfK
MTKEGWYKIIIVFFIFAFFNAFVAAFWLWQEWQGFEPDVYYYVPPDRSFIYSSREIGKFGFEKYIEDKVTSERARLIQEEKSFIDLDLEDMELSLYRQGEKHKTFPVLSKGKEGSWWETAPGVYFVGDKVVYYYVARADIWVPYAVQFYGNFFIHGWPYYSGGRDLPKGPSSGCIRLDTDDATVVYEFAQRGMPVLVFDEKPISNLPALISQQEKISSLEVLSEALMAADLDTGEVLLDKKIKKEFYAGPLVEAMMALAASEIVNLKHTIVAREWMFSEIGENIIKPGKSYQGYELIDLLLQKNSKEAALTLARFFTPDLFVIAMNTKAKAIGMDNTQFVDITGASQENITTLYDAARMMRYIHQYRGFIFETNKELKGPSLGGTESLFAFLKMKTPDNASRNIFIAIADSPVLTQDFETVLFWLEDNLGLKK